MSIGKAMFDVIEHCSTQEIEEKRQRQLVTKFAEIEVRLPIPRDNLEFIRLRDFLIDYTTFNTHIGFTFRIKDTSSYTLNFPQVQVKDKSGEHLLHHYI